MPKKPKLTPEEKKALKIAKKAEKKRLAELLKRQQQHDHISREIKYGKLTHKLHEKSWKEMLIKISLPRMREDLTYAWHNFERIIDSKDFTISLLMDEIKDAEEQYMMNLRCHAENIDHLIVVFRDRLNELKTDSENEIAAMQVAAEKEAQDIRTTAAESEEYLKTMLFGLEMARKEQEKLVRGEYLSKIDEETTKYSDILQRLRVDLEKSFSDLWNKTKNFLNDYLVQTAERRKLYNVIKLQDDDLQQLCEQQLIKIYKMQEFIKRQKQRLVNLQEIQGQKIMDFQEERKYFADAFAILRIRLENDQALDNANLQILATESNTTIEYLEKLKRKGEKFLQLAAVCRKFETEKEKVLPFPAVTIYPGKLGNVSEIKLDVYKNTSSNMQLFWQRVAQTDATRHSINEEREYLIRENRRLKREIHRYCLCIECPPETKVGIKKSPRCINRIDGNVVKKTYQKHG